MDLEDLMEFSVSFTTVGARLYSSTLILGIPLDGIRELMERLKGFITTYSKFLVMKETKS